MFYINLFFLASICSLMVKRTKFSFAEKIIAAVIIFWASLILTGYLLAAFKVLNEKNLFFFVSILISICIGLLLEYFIKSDFGKDVSANLKVEKRDKFNQVFFIFNILFYIIILFGALLICFYFLPNNPDTEAYRLPRVYFYKASGSLGHFATGVDPRLIFYPLNGVLSHLIVVVYGVDARWLHFFTFLSWILSGVIVYAFSRRIGASIVSSTFAGFITITTQDIFMLSTAGNDEVMAAVPMFGCLLFAYIWVTKNSLTAYLLSLLAILISITIKEHFVFYWLFFLLLIVYLLRSGKWAFVTDFLRANWIRILIASILIIFVFFVHIVINYESSGQLSSNLGEQIVNSKLNILLPFQNFAIYLLQMALAPIPDLMPKAKLSFLLGLYSKCNFLFSYLITWVNTTPDFISPFDKFSGLLLIPESAFRMESTVWFGFVPHTLIAFIILFRKNSIWRSSIGPWLIASFFIWIFAFSSMIKFQYTIQSYFSYAILFAMPAIALGYDLSLSESRWKIKVLFRFAFLILFTTNVLFSYNILRDCVRRNLKSVIANKFQEPQFDKVDYIAEKIIKDSSKIHLLASHWEVPFLKIINKNPNADYSVSALIREEPELLNIALYQAISNYGNFLIDLPWKHSDGLGSLGKIETTYGPEFMLCYQIKSKDCSGKIVKLFSLITISDQSFEIKIAGRPLGEKNEDHLVYKFAIVDKEKGVRKNSNWVSLARGETFEFKDERNALGKVVLEIEVRSKISGKSNTVKEFSLSPGFEYSL